MTGNEKSPTAILMMNMGGPASLSNVGSFLMELFNDHKIMHLLRAIAKEQGRSVVIVSHDQRIKDIADRVLWLEDGQFKAID